MVATMRELLERRGTIRDQLQHLGSTAETNGNLSDDEQRKFDALRDEFDQIELRIKNQAVLDAADRAVDGETQTERGDDRFDAEVRRFSLCRAIAAQIEPRSANAGREVEIAQELAKRSGRQAQGMFIPLNALVEQRVQVSSGDAGNLIATEHLANEFIDALRPATVVGRLGGRILTGMRGDISIPKMDSLVPAVEWIAEDSGLTGGDHSFTAVTATPYTAGLLTEWSRKVLLQADPTIESLVRSDFTAKLAAGVDAAALKGTGSGDDMPQGIIGTVGVQAADGLGDYEAAVFAVAAVEGLDVPPGTFGWAMNAYVLAKLATTLRTSADTASNFVVGADRTLAGFPVGITSQLEGGLTGSPNTGEALFGAWNNSITLFWGEVNLLVNPYAATPYSKGNVQLRALVSVDHVLRYPQAFVRIGNIAMP